MTFAENGGGNPERFSYNRPRGHLAEARRADDRADVG
jgi:hypothetical protein